MLISQKPHDATEPELTADRSFTLQNSGFSLFFHCSNLDLNPMTFMACVLSRCTKNDLSTSGLMKVIVLHSHKTDIQIDDIENITVKLCGW